MSVGEKLEYPEENGAEINIIIKCNFVSFEKVETPTNPPELYM